MNDTTDTVTNGKLAKVAEEVERIQLMPGTKDVLDTFEKSIDQVFDHSMKEIDKVFALCTEAKENLERRRKAMKDSARAYVDTLQVCANTTAAAHRAIGEVLVTSESI